MIGMIGATNQTKNFPVISKCMPINSDHLNRLLKTSIHSSIHLFPCIENNQEKETIGYLEKKTAPPSLPLLW